MSFLEDFDRRAAGKPNPNETPEDRELLDFADLIRSRCAAPDEIERERILARVKRDARPVRETDPGFSWAAVAALLILGIGAFLVTFTGMPGNRVVKEEAKAPDDKKETPPIRLAVADAKTSDDFSGLDFPTPKVADVKGAAAVETERGAKLARITLLQGLAMISSQESTRRRVAVKGDTIKPGDIVTTGRQSGTVARILSPDGTSILLAPGTDLIFFDGRLWRLNGGTVRLNIAAAKDLPPFVLSSHAGTAVASGTVTIGYSNRHLMRAWIPNGNLDFKAPSAKDGLPAPGIPLDLSRVPYEEAADVSAAERSWLNIEAEADHGIGSLVANAEKDAQKLPLEIVQHAVNVTVIDQVARTFVDEVFVNNTDRRLEGVFYYPLPADASISEFAMYVDGKRIVGEVLEQQRARQVFEYIVRQQRDPALLEFAGGNLFKMRVFPIEPRSEKRIQLGYTQILPRRNGKVTYTYPLFSEKLLKNPLHDLSLEFRAYSSAGLKSLESASHRVASAMSDDGKRGAVAFRAKEYTPSQDFSVSYDVPEAAECVATSHTRDDDPNGYFMLQICPQTDLPERTPPERMLVIVDGSASAGPQDYAVASEFAASASDVSANWEFGLVRGGQRPVTFGAGLAFNGPETGQKMREFLGARPPLGATDLIATFTEALKSVDPAKGQQLVYVGDGIDTASELSGPALVKAIVELFKGKNATLSTVAVGSNYDKAVLAGLAAELGGTFTRVEGAADVHKAVGQVFDGFYRAMLWDMKVSIENLETLNVYPERLGSLAAGDTAIVIGRVKGSGPAAVKVSFDVGGKWKTKTYDVTLAGDAQKNRFLPRLWAKAHDESLLARMGLGSAQDDARLKQEVIETSVRYQIMSPYTAFLVLESEEDYARYGINRTLKMSHGHAAEPARKKESKKDQRAAGGEFEDDEFDALTLPQSNTYSGSLRLDDLSEFNLSESIVAQELEGLGDTVNLRSLSEEVSKDRELEGEEFDGRRERLAAAKQDLSSLSLSDEVMESEFDGASLAAGRNGLRRNEGKSRGTWARDYDAREMSASHIVSPVFQGQKIAAELAVDQPLRPVDHYERLLAKNAGDVAARLNLALALETQERYADALKVFAPLVEALPQSIDISLQDGTLRHRTGDAAGGDKALLRAVELAPEKDRRELRARIAGLLAAIGSYETAADRHAELARTAGTPNEALKAAVNATAVYGSAKKLEKAWQLWEDLLKTWPDSHELQSGYAKHRLMNNADKNKAMDAWRELRKRIAEARPAAKTERVPLYLKAHDAIGKTLSFKWTQIEGPPVKIIDQAPEDGKLVSETYFIPTVAGRYVFEVAVTNEKGEVTKTKLFRDVEGEGGKVNAVPRYEARFDSTWVYALANAGFKDDALEACRTIIAESQKPEDIAYAIQSLGRTLAVAQVQRILESGASTPAAVTAATSYYAMYEQLKGRKAARAFIDAVLKRRETLSSAARVNAFLAVARVPAFANANTAELRSLLDPVFQSTAGADTALAIQAVGTLSQFDADGALARIPALRKREALTEEQRWQLDSSEAAAFNKLKRTGDADRVFESALAAAKTDVAAHRAASQWFWARQNDGDGSKAMEIIEAFGKRFPESNLVLELYSQSRYITSRMKPADAEAWRVRLAVSWPHPTIISSVARQLARQGRWRDAAEVQRKAIAAVPEKTADRGRRRTSLIVSLGRICARDAELREAFLKEARASAAQEESGYREWTEGTLACLESSGDVAAHLEMLRTLAAAEPDDPQWARRHGLALLREKRPEARAVLEAHLTKRPSDAGVALALHDLCARSNDAAAAGKYLDQAMEALKRSPNALQNRAGQWQQSRPELSLRAYLTLTEIEDGSRTANLYQAGTLLRGMKREREATDVFLRLIGADDDYAGYAYDQLAELAANEDHLRRIEPAVRGMLATAQKPSAPVFNLLMWRIEELRNHPEAAAAALNTAANTAGALPAQLADRVCRALISAKLVDRAEKFAIASSERQTESSRGSFLRQLANGFNNEAQRAAAIRIHRIVMELEGWDAHYSRGNLIELLLADGKLDEAEKALREWPDEQNGDASYSWGRLIDAYVNRENHVRAIELSLEVHELGKDAESYIRDRADSQLIQAIHRISDKKVTLPPALREQVRAVILSSALATFDGRLPDSGGLKHGLVDTVKFLGLTQEVEALCRAAAESDDPNRVLMAARFRRESNSHGEARVLFRRAAKLQGEAPTHAALQELYPLITESKGADWTEALSLVERLEALKYPDPNWILREKARCLYSLGRTEPARAAARECLALGKRERYGLWNLQVIAELCSSMKDWPMALEAWELTLKAGQRYAGARNDHHTLAQFYVSASRAYAAAGQAEKALDCCLRGMSLVPRDHAAYQTLLGVVLEQSIKKEGIDKAVASLDAAAKNGGDKPHLRIAFGEAYAQKKEARKSLAQFLIAANLLPKDMPLRKKVIDGYQALNDSEAALAAHFEWAKVDPQNIEVYRSLGDLYQKLGRSDDAFLAWATMAEVRPREAEGYRAYAGKLTSAGKRAEAAVELRKALRWRPTEHEIANELAVLYGALNQTDRIPALWTDGEAACRKAMEELPDDPLPWLNLGRFLESQKKRDEARALYEKITLCPWPRFRNETVEEARKRMETKK